MSKSSPHARATHDREEPDEWLLEAARRMGLPVPTRSRTPGTTAWRFLLNAGIADDEVLRLACTVSGAEAADFTHLSPAMGCLLSQGEALKHRVVPLGVHNGALAIATSNPLNPVLERELAFAAKQRVRLHPGSPAEIIRAQAIVYGAAYGARPDSAMATSMRSTAPSATQPQPAPVARLSLSMPAIARSAPADATLRPTPSAPIPGPVPGETSAPTNALALNLTERLLLAASTERASEALLEPASDGGLLVRLRVDGALHDRFRIAEAHAAQMVQTFKQHAGLDVNETRRAQEGRSTFDAPNGRVGLRVSTELVRDPSGDSRERVVVRFFATNGLLRLADLGFSAAEQHRLSQLLAIPTGLLIIAGPPRSGKTTTLYAAARELHQRRQVSTIEEQTELPLDGISQLQLRGSVHASLGAALLSVGRGASSSVVVTDAPLDAPTLEQCANQTGRARLVVASLDTPDLASTLARLRALHPDGAPLAASLHGVVLQRLVRRLCTACALPELESTLPALQQRLLYGLPMARVRRPLGCPVCRTSGYRGRMAIVELVPVTPALRDAITRRASPAELVYVARESGISTLWDSGMQHVLAGDTSLAELLDSVSPPETGDKAPQEDIDALLAQLLGSSAPRLATGRPPGAAAASKPSATPRVLVVDDDAAGRRVRARELSESGFIVSEAADGTSALELAKRLRPDVVVTEFALPGLDAIGLLGALESERLAVRVVVLTAQPDEAMDRWLEESGARAVLRRDLSTALLAKRLHELSRAPRD